MADALTLDALDTLAIGEHAWAERAGALLTDAGRPVVIENIQVLAGRAPRRVTAYVVGG